MPAAAPGDEQRADRRERRQIDQAGADVHRPRDRQRLDAAHALRQVGHHRQERRQHDAGRAAVDRHDAGAERDDRRDRRRRGDAGDAGGEEIQALGLFEQRDQHGHAGDHQDHAPRHALDRLLLVDGAQQDQQRRDDERHHADVHAEARHADDQHRDPGRRQPVARLHRPPIAGSAACTAPASRRLNSRQPPSRKKPPKPTMRVRERVVGVGLPLDAAQADARHHAVGDDAGRRERRQRAGQRAVARHDGHQQRRNAGAARDGHRRRREQRARRRGAGADRGDDEAEHEEHDRQHARRGRGTAARRAPSAARACRCDSAMLKSSVTPTSVTNSAMGNPASTASGDMPPR